MKKLIVLFILALSTLNSYTQSEFKKSLIEIIADLSSKLSKKGKSKIVILYITDINKSNTVAGKYLADKISVNIVNDTANFQVFDRENLSGIVEAKKMMADGYIDVDKAKELGKLLSVDAIIIGSYTILSKTIDLTLKALDSSTGFVIAASTSELPLDGDAGALLGINISSSNNEANVNNGNRGFNDRPLNSNEQYNNPETVNKDCGKNKTGDYCFVNNTSKQIMIYLGDAPNRSFVFSSDPRMILASQQTQCFYNLKVGNWYYFVDDENHSGSDHAQMGQINVELCKSKTFIIK